MRAKVAKQAQLTSLLDEQLDWREEVAAEEAAEARQVGATGLLLASTALDVSVRGCTKGMRG